MRIPAVIASTLVMTFVLALTPSGPAWAQCFDPLAGQARRGLAEALPRSNHSAKAITGWRAGSDAVIRPTLSGGLDIKW